VKRALALVLLLAAACKEEPPAARRPDKPEDTPNFEAAFQHKERWDPAKKALVVELTIAPGFHAYTTGEATGKPLAVELAPDSDLVANGAIEYPKGAIKDLPIGRSVIVEGSAEIVAPAVLKEGAGSPPKLRGTLRYQICTEKSCDRPRSTKFEL